MIETKDITNPSKYGCTLHINKPVMFDPSKPVALDVETDEADMYVGLAMCQSDTDVYYYDKDQWCDEFADFLGTFKYIMQGGKFDIRMLKKWGVRIDYSSLVWDTKIMAYSLDSTMKSYSLKQMAQKHLNLHWPTYKDMVGSGKKKATLDKQDVQRVAQYCGMDTLAQYQLYKYFKRRMSEKQLHYYDTIEMPLYRFLSKIEDKGIFIDKEYLTTVGEDLKLKHTELEESFVQLGFNPRSPKQILKYFKECRIPAKKTDAATLKELEDSFPVVRRLLEYRKFKKIDSTYVEPFIKDEDGRMGETLSDGRIHANFTQSTITGRLASSKPNMQNIPAPDPDLKRFRVDVGTMIRSAFIAPPGHKLLVLDYSQIEYRLFAHFTQEPVLLEAFHNGRDVHQETARAIGCPDDRRLGKTINFAAIYGAQAKRIAATLGIHPAIAQEKLDAYWLALPRAAGWITMQKLKARRNGGVTTMQGRFIPLPLINSTSKFERLHYERVAVNAIVQGSAAEVIKLAMLELEKHNLLPVMQVHDELMFEVPEENALDSYKKVITNIMEGAVKISVPLLVEGNYGYNWATAK